MCQRMPTGVLQSNLSGISALAAALVARLLRTLIFLKRTLTRKKLPVARQSLRRGSATESMIRRMFEHRTAPLLPRHHFFLRVLGYIAAATVLVGTALGLGVLGYHHLGGLPWIDALVNASMILGGMGPVDPIASDAGKLFASFYALFSGLAFIGITAVLVAPFAHRLLHRLHLHQGEK